MLELPAEQLAELRDVMRTSPVSSADQGSGTGAGARPGPRWPTSWGWPRPATRGRSSRWPGRSSAPAGVVKRKLIRPRWLSAASRPRAGRVGSRAPRPSCSKAWAMATNAGRDHSPPAVPKKRGLGASVAGRRRATGVFTDEATNPQRKAVGPRGRRQPPVSRPPARAGAYWTRPVVGCRSGTARLAPTQRAASSRSARHLRRAQAARHLCGRSEHGCDNGSRILQRTSPPFGMCGAGRGIRGAAGVLWPQQGI